VFRSIVVGCDGSDQSLRAIELAEQLRADEGRLTLVSVFPFYRGFAAPVTPILYAEWLQDQARESLDRAVQQVSAGVPFETQPIAAPSAGSGLNDIAESVNADLIVLGPSHRAALGRLTGRTTVQRLLHGAPCAIAVAAPDQRERFDGEATIAVAYDGSEEAVHARDVAYELAANKHAAVQLCAAIEPLVYAAGYDTPPPDAALDESRNRAAQTSLAEAARRAPSDVTVDVSIRWGAPPNTVLELAGDDVSLIVAGSRGYGTLRRAMAGATSGTLLTNGRVPVLVTPRAACQAESATATAAAAVEA
jgi:nucleotide-binding universal stress UspA family protein